MDFNERVIPNVTSNFLYQEALSRYIFASRYLNKNSIVLDLGCGTGYGASFLAGKSRSTKAIDVDKEAIRYAKRKYKHNNLEFKCQDLYGLKFKRRSFDVICMFEVIEHLERPDAILNLVTGWLKNDGVFVLSTPNKAIYQSINPYHVHEYSKEEIYRFLRTYFSCVDVFGQSKTRRAQAALVDFMYSQTVRQNLVNSDRLGIRKLIPRSAKEKIWKLIGNRFGRISQEMLSVADFPIVDSNINRCEYFVAVCRL